MTITMKSDIGNKGTKNREHKKSTAGYSSALRVESIAHHLSENTHFNLDECKSLLYMHQRIRRHGQLDRMRMREILHVLFDYTDAVMLDFAFKAFDRDTDGHVDEYEWVIGLSTILRGTTDELSEWCYFMYDINGDGGLAREELAHCLKGCIIPGWGIDADDIEDCEREIVEIAMSKLDCDRDGQVSLLDFKRVCKKDPLMLVSVGPSLPPMKSCAAFLALVTEKYHSYTGPLGRPAKHKRKTMDRRKSHGHGPVPSAVSSDLLVHNSSSGGLGLPAVKSTGPFSRRSLEQHVH